jgi:hypothetical protein
MPRYPQMANGNDSKIAESRLVNKILEKTTDHEPVSIFESTEIKGRLQ